MGLGMQIYNLSVELEKNLQQERATQHHDFHHVSESTTMC